MLTRLAVVALIAFASLADRAGAQVVGGTLPGPTLEVADTTEDGLVRMEVKVGVADPGESFGRLVDMESGDPPLWPDQAIVAEAEQSVADGVEHVTFGGVVDAAAATVELGFGAGRFARVPTFAGEAYTGRHAGLVRFFMGEITLSEPGTDDDPASIRLFDASGAVIGAPLSPDITHDVRVLRRGVAGAVVRMTASLRSEPQPLPFAPEHRSEKLCLDIGVQSAGDEPEVACLEPDQPLTLGGRRGCGRRPSMLAGFAPATTDHLAVRLGSGRTVSVATRPAPFGRAARMVTALLAPGEAIRGITAIDAGGTELARAALLVAPPDRRCGVDYRYEDFRFYDETPARRGAPPGTEVAAALDGGPRMLVRDAGELLCAGFDQLDLDGADCFPPPVTPRFGSELYSDPKRGFVAALYPARVATLELQFSDGGRARVLTVAGTGYTGRFRDTTRFVLAATPVGRPVLGATLLDAAGRDIGGVGAGGPVDDPALVALPKTALRAGSIRLRVGAYSTPISSERTPCFAIAIAGAAEDCLDETAARSANAVQVRVRCDRRQTVIFGTTRSGVSRVDVLVAGGRRVRARLAPLVGGQHVYLAVLGPRAAATGVRFTGGPKPENGRTFVLPGQAPARQCGYESRGELF